MTFHILTSGYSTGLHVIPLNNGLANTAKTKEQDVDANMSYSVFDSNTGSLYGVHEVSNHPNFGESGAVSRWKYQTETAQWVRMEMFSSGGEDPAHIALDAERELLYVTNYSGGSLSVFRLNKGEIMDPPIYHEAVRDGGSKVDPDRQEASHLHGTFLFRDFVYVVDLGGDKIFHYRVVGDSVGDYSIEKATPAETILSPGSGPRHMAVDIARARVYVMNELVASIVTLFIDEKSGALREVATLKLDLPIAATEKERQYGAGIELRPDGKFLYTSNRGKGAILVFAVSADPPLQQVEAVLTGGTWPRHFAITEDGKHLLAADQRRSIVDCFDIDAGTGRLNKKGEVESCKQPSVVLLVRL